MTIKSISVTDVYQLNQESGAITIIDVREVAEYAEVSSTLAINIPLSTFDAKEFGKTHKKSDQIYMLCRSGKRSHKAAQLLEAAGFASLYNIEGGMLAWEAAGLPVVKK